MITDTPTHRQTIAELSLEDLDAELDVLRERRLTLSRQLTQLSATKRAQHMAAAIAKFDRGREKVRRAIERLIEATMKIENEMNKLRALQLEVEDDNQ